MAIAKLMPEIAMLDRLRVGLPHVVNAHESAQHRKMAGNRIMQPCKKPVYNMHTSTWMNVEARASGTRPDHASIPGRFEGSHNSCSDRDDSASPSTGSINGICGRAWGFRDRISMVSRSHHQSAMSLPLPMEGVPVLMRSISVRRSRGCQRTGLRG